MSEANNVHPSEVGLVTPPVLSKKEQAKLANILGFFRDAAEEVFPVQGFEVMTDPTRNVLLERMIALRPGTLVAQRARLEADTNFRHPIPYILIHRQREDGSLEFFVYQRTKLIGEELLGQKFSLALGGHPEVPSIRFDEEAQFDTEQSLLACLVAELDEEASFGGQSFTEYTEGGGLYTFSHDGFLRDDSDKVGLQHIGIVYTIGLPMGVEVVCLEEELVTVGFRTLEELSADLELPEANAIYDFENWSKLCIRSWVERIEATKAAEAVDALFLSEQVVGGETVIHDEAGTYLRGQRPEVTPIDELAFAAEGDIGRGLNTPQTLVDEEEFVRVHADSQEDQSWRQEQLEDTEAMAAMVEALPPEEPLNDATRMLYLEHSGIDLDTLVLPDAVRLVSRGDMAFMVGEILHPVDGSKPISIMVDPSDPNPLTTYEAIKVELLSQWDQGFSGVVTAETVDAFAQEIIDQADRPLSAGPNGDWKPHNPEPVDPSAETKVLTEAHREIGVSDEQMKRGIDELVRISDEAQPSTSGQQDADKEQ